MKCRSRLTHLAALAGVILVGLASRRFHIFPSAFGKYPGDVLWGLMVYLIIGLLSPRLTVAKTALAAGLFSLFIELFKLYPSPALAHFRTTTVGGLMLGHEFSGANLIAYGIGIAIGAAAEALVRQKQEVQS